VYFEKKVEANRALDEGNNDEHLVLSLNFGGRRDFCKRRYEDLDEEHLHDMTPHLDNLDEDFDYCLQHLQRSSKRKKHEVGRELTQYNMSDVDDPDLF